MRSIRLARITLGAILTILFIVLTSSFFITEVSSQGTSEKSAFTNIKAIRGTANTIDVVPDTYTANGQANITWNITRYSPTYYGECFVSVFTNEHTQELIRFPIVNPTTNKTYNFKVPLASKYPAGTYYVNLWCRVPGGYLNHTPGVHNLESITLDIMSLSIGTKNNAAIRAYFDKQTPQWKAETSQGFSYNISLGVPI